MSCAKVGMKGLVCDAQVHNGFQLSCEPWSGVWRRASNTPCIPGNGGTYKANWPFHLAKIVKLEVRAIRTKPTC